MNSINGHKIRQREVPNDVWITPEPLAKKQIDMVSASLESMVADKQDDSKTLPFLDEMVWYDPFRNSGNYFHQFPKGDHEWSEILDGRDFFEFNKHVDVICSNPPYSCLNKILAKLVEIKPLIISLLLGLHNITPKRLEFLNKNGYYLEKLHLCRVSGWYGMSVITQFKLGAGENIMSYDRVPWK